MVRGEMQGSGAQCLGPARNSVCSGAQIFFLPIGGKPSRALGVTGPCARTVVLMGIPPYSLMRASELEPVHSREISALSSPRLRYRIVIE